MTLHRRHFDVMCSQVFFINQCQIITFLILKSDIENSRIEMRGIVLPAPSNQIKVTFIIIAQCSSDDVCLMVQDNQNTCYIESRPRHKKGQRASSEYSYVPESIQSSYSFHFVLVYFSRSIQVGMCPCCSQMR